MKKRIIAVLMLLTLIFLTLSGCGGGPKADVSIFMMGPQGIPQEAADKLKNGLVAKVGQTPTIELMTTPLFSLEKVIVEIAAGEHSIIIVPEEQFQGFAKQGGLVPLDDLVKPDDYKEGIVESNDQGKVEKHLYGIPLADSKWFKDQGLNGKGLYAFIPGNGKNKDQAKQVLKLMAEK
jgi:ABC-type glycerol-3-phosphate transport system substrate-binding protein